MQTREELYDYLGYHEYEQKLDALFAERRRSGTVPDDAIDDRHDRRPHAAAATAASPRSPSRCPASPPATPRCAPSAAPATTCTTAATTSSTSPTTCEFEEIAYLLVHGKLPTVAELAALQGEAARRCAACPPPVQDGARAHPGRRASDGRDAHRRARCWAARCRRRTTTSDAGARDIADRLMASLGSMLLYWYHCSHNGRRIDVETDDDSIGGHFLHLLHGKPPARAVGARDAHLAHPLRRARVQRLDLRRARHRRHGLRHVLGDHRRHRRAARARSTAAPTRSPSTSRTATTTPDEAEADIRRARRGEAR